MRMTLSNTVMSSACAWLSRRERYQIIAFSSKVSVISRLTDAVPRGIGLRAKTKTSLSLDWSSSLQRVDGRQSNLSEVGARIGVPGSVSQMWTVLMATLESVSMRRRMRDRSPCGPPSASRALSSSPQTGLITSEIDSKVIFMGREIVKLL